MKYKIPEEEQANFISVYWQMLRELENRVDPEKDVLDKHLVEGAYRLLDRSGIISTNPEWTK